MKSDETVLAEIDDAFGGVEKPEHFHSDLSDPEYADHDALLRSRDRETLRIDDVGNVGYDPICSSLPHGIAYYFPTLARFALNEPTHEYGWYAWLLLLHLSHDGPDNAFYSYCSPRQRAAVASFLAFVIESRTSLAKENYCYEELMKCYELWNNPNP